MDFERTIAGPAAELASALSQASRLSELLRTFGEHLLCEYSVEVFDVWWLQKPARGSRADVWARGEFRVPGARDLNVENFGVASKTVESDLEDLQFNPPGQILTGDFVTSDSGKGFYVAVQGSSGRWLVVFLRESVHALKVWRAQAARGRSTQIPEHLANEIRESLFAIAVQSFAGHARRQFELEDARKELYIDALTGLYNSRYLDLSLDMEVRRASRFGTSFCVLFVDVDAFKVVNDTHGHLSGSSMLAEMGAVIKDAVREVDVVARYGGDEFVLVLLGAAIDTGKVIAERVRERVAAHRFRTVADSDHVHVTVSIGISAFPENAKNKEELLRMADETMYSSKKSGKNRVTVQSTNLGGSHAGQGRHEITV